MVECITEKRHFLTRSAMESRIQRIEIIDDRMAELLRTKTETERFAMIDRF